MSPCLLFSSDISGDCQKSIVVHVALFYFFVASVFDDIPIMFQNLKQMIFYFSCGKGDGLVHTVQFELGKTVEVTCVQHRGKSLFCCITYSDCKWMLSMVVWTFFKTKTRNIRPFRTKSESTTFIFGL